MASTVHLSIHFIRLFTLFAKGVKGVKGQILNFVIMKAVVNIFADISHAGRAAIDTKRIKGDFSLNVWVRSPRVDLGGRTEAKNNRFGHVAYQIKADDACSKMVANILHTDTPLTLGWGQKVKPYLFLKVVMLLVKLKGIEHGAP